MVFDDTYVRLRPYNAWLAYGQAKTANVPVRRGSDGSPTAEGITATALNPGGILKRPSVTWTAGSPHAVRAQLRARRTPKPT